MSAAENLTRSHGVTEGRACRTPHSASFAARFARGIPATAVPRLRFKGFEGEWKKAKLSQFLSVNDERNAAGKFEITDVFSVSREFGVINQIEYQGRSFAGASLANYRVIHKGQITYTKSPLKAQPYGIIKANKTKSGILSALYGVYDCLAHSSPEFIQTYFEKDDRLNSYLRPLINKGAKNTILVSDEEAVGGNVTFPSPPEQSRIADFFSNLDAAIAAAKARVGKLRRVKKAMLVKMFPREGATAPEIRFKGFEGEWEKKTLGSLVSRVTRKNLDLESDLPLTISAEYGLVDQSSFFNSRVAAKNVSNYYLVKRGEFAYNKSTSDGYPFGAVKRLDRYPMGVLSTLYIVFAIEPGKVDSDYLVHFYDTKLWHRDVALRAAEGARNHGLLNIASTDFFETNVLLPRDVAEQRKIGAFFNNLDKLIAAAEKRVGKLKQVKAALLEGMFA